MAGSVAETARLVASLELQDKFSGRLGAVERRLGGFETRFGRVSRGVGQVAGGIDRLATVAGVAAAGGLAAVVKTAVDFEDAFAGVRKTVEATEPQLKALEGTFREMARTIPLSFEELAGLGETAGALGIATENIEEFTRVSALLGVTTDVSAQDAATALGQLSNVLQLTREDYDNFAATLVDLGNKGASTESQILTIASRAGASADLIGIASDQTLGWASAVANLGIEVEAGGSAIQKFFIGSLKNLEDSDALEAMAETAGTTARAFKKAFEEDASGALETFLRGLGELDEAAQLAVLKTLGFTDIRITRALLGLANNTDNLTNSLNIAGDAWEANTALTTEAEKRFATTASQFVLLKNNIRDVAATIGGELLPVANDLIKDFVGELNKPGTQEGIRNFAEDLADGIRGLVQELKGTDFSGIIGGMKIAAQVAKGAFDAFRALPEPIQQLAVAALVANKVSGGAVGQIARGLVNIGGGLFGGRGATPANPLFTKDVGLGGVGGGVAGAAGGRFAGAGRLLAGVTTVGIAAIIADTIEPEVTGLGKDLGQGWRDAVDDALGVKVPTISPNELEWPFGPKNTPTILPEIFGGNGLLGGTAPEPEEGSRSIGRAWGVLDESIDETRETVRDLNDPLRALHQLQERSRADAAAADRAMLTSLSSVKAAADNTTNSVRTTASNTAAQLLRIESVERMTSANTARTESTLARKNFSPNIDVGVTVNSNVSISDILRQSITQHVATDLRGGWSEI